MHRGFRFVRFVKKRFHLSLVPVGVLSCSVVHVKSGDECATGRLANTAKIPPIFFSSFNVFSRTSCSLMEQNSIVGVPASDGTIYQFVGS